MCCFRHRSRPMSLSTSHGESQTGLVREDNQDSIRLYRPEDEQLLQQQGELYAVADGMGGYEHGGVASALALETLFKAFYGGSPGKSAQKLRQGIQEANI